jgi:hypothetical protein
MSDLTNLPEGDGYRLVVRDGQQRVIRISDGKVWDGQNFVDRPTEVVQHYGVQLRTLDADAGRAQIETALRAALGNRVVLVEVAASYKTRG